MVKEIDHTLSVHRHDIKRRQRKTQIEIERERCLCVSGTSLRFLPGYYSGLSKSKASVCAWAACVQL